MSARAAKSYEIRRQSVVRKNRTTENTLQYKRLKGLKKENLRDNMTTLELVLNMLAKTTATAISKKKLPETFEQNKEVARVGGEAAGKARVAVEKRTGEPVITAKNAVDFSQLISDVIDPSEACSLMELKIPAKMMKLNRLTRPCFPGQYLFYRQT